MGTVASIAMVGLVGCAERGLNDRLVLGGEQTIAALTGDASVETTFAPSGLRSMGRGAWRARRFVVPVDGTVHKPIRRWGMTAAGGNARRTGLWPTLESSLLVSDEPSGALVVEGLTAWIEAYGELKLLPLEIVRAPAIGRSGLRMSPWGMYKRYPETGEWTNVSGAEIDGAQQERE